MTPDPNEWCRESRYEKAQKITTGDIPDEAAKCPNCGHLLSHHSVDLGCHVGWDSHLEGCVCPLTLALQHNPKREAEVKAP